MKRIIEFCIALLMLGGCASMNAKLLPSKVATTTHLCKSYAEAKTIYDSLEPYKTTLADLEKTCFNPNQPNTNILSPRLIQQMFLSSPAVKFENLPEGIQECLKEFVSCKGFDSPLKDVLDKAVGNVVTRAFRFKRDNLATGPDISFQFFFLGTMMVHKDYFGTPNVNRISKERNPLGPIQEFGDFIIKMAPTP